MNNLATFLRESRVGRFFIPAGIILIIFSVFAFKAVDKAKNYVKIDANVTKTELYEKAYTDDEGTHHEATYKVFVKYVVDGTEYEEEYGIFSNYKIGDKVKISYNPKNPKEIAQPNTIILPIIILALGVISLVGGIISVIRSIKKHKELKLQEEGWKNGN